MKLSEIRAWQDKACIVTWLDSGAIYGDDDVEKEYHEMVLSTTHTSGVLVFVGRNDEGQSVVVLEHEKESGNFDDHSHSVIATKCVLEIGNKRRG